MSTLLSLRVRASQGRQFIEDLRKAVPAGLRGRPALAPTPCAEGCAACRDVCPTNAVQLAPLTLDLGRCVFCNECVEACPAEKISFTPEARMGATTSDELLLREGDEGPTRVRASATFARVFGRSLRMRQVSAGGCNACELELNALANVNFDLQRFGIEWVASPRHADALVLTGPLTLAMKEAVTLTWDAMPEPRFVVAVGACAISGGLYAGAPGVDRAFLDAVGPALYVPGCPPHPLTFVHAILDLLGRP
jgi:Ni,Fe-hydrogenase III small subunit/Pyruvate/2-oxoacid:ferredoxin oxidoreductase delta subunit